MTCTVRAVSLCSKVTCATCLMEHKCYYYAGSNKWVAVCKSVTLNPQPHCEVFFILWRDCKNYKSRKLNSRNTEGFQMPPPPLPEFPAVIDLNADSCTYRFVVG